MRTRIFSASAALCAVLLIGLLVNVATAGFMTVNNHNFESPDVTGWSSVMPTG